MDAALVSAPEPIPGSAPGTAGTVAGIVAGAGTGTGPGPVSGTSAGSGAAVPGHVARQIAGGTSALGAGVVLERGLGFVANVLAARLGGAGTFGAYSLALTTANSISTYAAGGIGATAARFSGKYPRGSARYPAFARALGTVSLASALVAGLALLLGAAPVAHLLGKPSLTPLLRWAALSAAGVLLLESARGFFVGQRRIRALLLLSVSVGLAMAVLLPLAARSHHPARMIILQGTVTTGAVALCCLLRRPLGLLAPERAGVEAVAGVGAMIREVWSFGLVQLGGLVGSNLAGWWLVSLVARGDGTLVQTSFFAVASQLRNLAGLGPSLLTEGSYAALADAEGEQTRTPDGVMAVCTFLTVAASLLLASVATALLPWGLRLLYGASYRQAAMATALALAVAVVHMGNAPAAARLTVVSIRTTAVINTVWAVFVAGVGTAFLLRGANAAEAMLVFLLGHLVSAALVLVALGRLGTVPEGMLQVAGYGAGGSTLVAALAFLREQHPAHAGALTLGMAAAAGAALLGLLRVGRQHGWMPSPAALGRMGGLLRGKLGLGGGAHGA